MTQLAPPGELVSTGHIRVDAARAVAKLREYQLADRTAWVLEAVRAAVASGARSIDLSGDSNDVWVRWEGDPWPDAVLPTLFDELVSPEPARDQQHLRLLGTAVNSALGLDPVYVDVTAIHADRAARVRYTPAVLVLAAGDETPALRQVAVEAVAAGGPPGMLVHLRRHAGLETLALLLRGGEPPEMVRARESCGDLSIPVRVGGVAMARRNLLRIPLGEGLDGFLAVTPMVPVPAAYEVMEVAEHGVVLARYPLDLGVELSLASVPVPIRLFIDAPRMPTNASRSDVRHDAHPIAGAKARARVLLPALLERLAAAFTAEPTEPLRAAALAILASVSSGAGWATKLVDDQLPAPHRKLAELPLVRNAVGQARAPRSAWRPLAVHVSDTAFPEALAPWLADVLWAPPGDPARWLVEGADLDQTQVRRLARGARRRARAHARFARHAPRAPRLDARVDHLAVMRLDAAWCEGEVAVLPSGGGRITLLYEERELAVVEVASPVPFEAIVGTAVITPLESYRGVEDDAQLSRVQDEVQATVLRAVEELARGKPSASALPTIRRAFLIGGVVAPSPLHTVACWPTATGTLASLAELEMLPVVGLALEGDRAEPPRGRTVVRARAELHPVLTGLLEPATMVVPYMPRPALGDVAAEMAQRLVWKGNVAALAVRAEDARGAVVWGGAQANVHLSHLGVALGIRPSRPTLAMSTILLDSDLIVPNASWTAMRHDGGALAQDLGVWEREMAVAVASALLGDPVPDLFPLDRPLRLGGLPAQALLGALADHDPDALLGAVLAARLRGHRMWTVLGSDERRSADELAAAFPTAIPALAATPVGYVGDWHPVIVEGAAVAALGRLARRDVHAADAELEQRQRDAVRARNVATHAARPVLPLALPYPTAHVEVVAPGVRGIVGVGCEPRLEIEVRIDDRPFQHVARDGDLPLVAAVNVESSRADPAFVELDGDELRKLVSAVADGATPLLVEIARAAPRALEEDENVRRLLVAWLASIQPYPSRAELAARVKLREAPAFATLQGGRASVKQASPAGRLLVASWMGAWLDAGDEPADLLDGPVLYVAEGLTGDAHRVLLTGLALDAVVDDVTLAVRKLQSGRRMARGAIATPRVHQADPAWTRKLADFGADGRTLGVGELALVDAADSRVLVHENGNPVGEVVLDVRPPVRLAIEAPDLADELAKMGSLGIMETDALASKTQALARVLVREGLAACDPAALPAWLIAGLRAARLADRVQPEDLGGVPVFETTAGTLVAWTVVESQQRMLGSVWYANPRSTALPLDENRIALRLGAAEVAAAFVGGLDLVEAEIELALDAEARANLARPVATTLEPAAEELRGALAVVDLDLDGASGRVAALAPGAEARRGVRVHRAMHPLGFIQDPCDWPTVAIVDDPRLTPDRTWSAPVTDEHWKRLSAAIKLASERAVGTHAPAPVGALAKRVLKAGSSGLPHGLLLEGARVRGRVWITDPDGAFVTVIVDNGQRCELSSPLPIRGEVVAFLPWQVSPQQVVDALATSLYPELVKSAARGHGATPVVVAHLLRALDTGVLTAEQVGELDAAGAAALAQRRAPEVPVAAAPREAPPPRPAHPLRGLAHALMARLHEIGAGAHVKMVDLTDAEAPPLVHQDGILWLSARSALLQGASSPALIDALAAHALTVLNQDLTAVTDATESHLVGQLLSRIR